LNQFSLYFADRKGNNMRKYYFLVGYCVNILLLISLNNYFWFTIGKSGRWIDNGVSLLFLFLIISLFITRSQYKNQYFEKSTSLKLALWFGVPTILLLIMSFMSDLDTIRFEHYFTAGMLVLMLNYLFATFAK
jgi:hypothetical protein